MRSKLILLLLVLLLNKISNAADYYWVGGTGNWSDFSNHWATSSGGSTFHSQIPTALDNVFFDTASFTSPGQIVTINPTIVQCRNMSWIGVTNNPNLSLPSSNTLRIFGSLTFVGNMSTNINGGVFFLATTTGQTITSAGKNFSSITFDGIGGGWSLQDALSSTNGVDPQTLLRNGALNTNNQTVTVRLFSTIDGGNITLTLGSSFIIVNGSWSTGLLPAASLNAGTSTIIVPGTLGTASFSPGPGNTYHNVSFPNTSTLNQIILNNGSASFTGTVSFVGNSQTFGFGSSLTFSKLNLSAGTTMTFSRNLTHVINDSFNATGTCGALINLKSSSPGNGATIQKTSGSVIVTYAVLSDITATGGASFTANNSIDLGNNTGWIITSPAPKDLYWVGNGGNWNDGNHWSLSSGGPASGCAPTPVDNVFFDANSFTALGQIVTINPTIVQCRNMSWVGVTNNPNLTLPSTNALRIYGSLALVPGMSTNIQGGVFFVATTTGQTITSAGKNFGPVTFDGIGGGWSLQDALNVTNGFSPEILLSKGTLNTNNQTVAARIFSALDGGGNALNLGSSVINVNGSWSTSGLAAGSLNAGTSTINVTPFFSTANFQVGQNQTYHNLNFPSTSASNQLILSNNNVTFTGTVSFAGNGSTSGFGSSIIFNNLTLVAGTTMTFRNIFTHVINGSFNATGTCGAIIDIKSSAAGNGATIQKASGSVALSYVALKDITATGGASFTANNSIDLGNNTGWIITSPAPKDLYWVGNGGNWNDGNHWSLSSGGPASGCAPTPVDNVFFDANSFTALGQIVTINPTIVQCRNMSWVGVTNNPNLTLPSTNALRIYGSLALVPGMSTNIQGGVFFVATTTGQTITSAGKNFGPVTFDGIGGGWSLQDALNVTNGFSPEILLSKGTLNTNNQTVAARIFSALDGGGNALNLGSSVINVNGSWSTSGLAAGSLNAGTSTINVTPFFSTANFQVGQNQTYHNLNFPSTSASNQLILSNNNVTFTGTVSFAGNGSTSGFGSSIIFNNLTLVAGTTMTFRNIFTHMINGSFNATGTPAFPIRIQSSITGVQATISKSSGFVCLDYVRMSDHKAIGGAYFNAGLSPTRSVDMGGNTGWVFTGITTFYQDADGDGYGNPNVTIEQCAPSPGYVTNNTDCNDANATIYPGAPEVCGNGIDDNCDGLTDTNCCTGTVSAGPDVNSYFGIISEQCVPKTAVVQNGTAPFTYAWIIDRPLLPGESITNANSGTVIVCLLDTANLCVTVTDANGCIFTDCANIFAQDVRCFAGNSDDHKIYVCHNNNTICVDQSTLAFHLNHGDYYGQCISNTLNIGETASGEIAGTWLKIYPNPGHGNFTLFINSAGSDINYVDAQIINMSGQIIKKVKINGQSKIDFAIKNAGVYFIRVISTDKKIVTRKVVVLE